eukprot:9386757-Pyramimonas_sp.AAC.1
MTNEVDDLDALKHAFYSISDKSAPRQGTPQGKQVRVRFRAATYHVMSLAEAKSGKLNRHQRGEKRRRLQRLRAQFADGSLLFVGLQEARMGRSDAA